MPKCATLFLLGFSTAAATVFAGPAPLKVYVEHSGDDSVGNAFVYQLKEALHKSALYPLADSGNSAALVLNIATIDTDRNRGNASAISWTLVAPKGIDLYLRSGAMMVAKNGVAEPVANLIAAVDRAVAGRRTDIPASNEWAEFEGKWKADVAAAMATLPAGLHQAYSDRMSAQLALFRISGMHADSESLAKAVAFDFRNSFEGGGGSSPSAELKACRAELAKAKQAPAPKKPATGPVRK